MKFIVQDTVTQKYYEQDAFGYSWQENKSNAFVFSDKSEAQECVDFFPLNKLVIEEVA